MESLLMFSIFINDNLQYFLEFYLLEITLKQKQQRQFSQFFGAEMTMNKLYHK